MGKSLEKTVNLSSILQNTYSLKKNLSKTCLKAPQNAVLWVHVHVLFIQFWILCWFSIFFSSLPGLEIHTSPIECDCQKKKWTTLNCLTDVNRFSELFYILLEVYRIDLKVVIELSAEKIIKGQKEFHEFFIPGQKNFIHFPAQGWKEVFFNSNLKDKINPVLTNIYKFKLISPI